jgi:hypothetical protein
MGAIRGVDGMTGYDGLSNMSRDVFIMLVELRGMKTCHTVCINTVADSMSRHDSTYC